MRTFDFCEPVVSCLPCDFDGSSSDRARSVASWAYDKARHNIGSMAFYSFNLIYSIVISLLFASFAYRRGEDNLTKGVGYAICSFLMNFPMAWVFADRTKDSLLRLVKKRERAFIACFVFSLFLAVGTTFSGLQVAVEQVNGVKFLNSDVLPLKILNIILIGFSAFNTFSTRFVGSTNLLFGIWLLVRDSVLQCLPQYKKYYQLLDDVKNHGSEHSIEIHKDKNNEQLLLRYAQTLYPYMHSKNIRAGSSWGQMAFSAGMLITTVGILSIFIVNMMPLWIRLTVEGSDKISKTLGNSAVFVMYAAASNELFYLNSGARFMSTLWDFSQRSYGVVNAAAKKFFKEHLGIKVATVASLVFFLGVWGAMAYYSGEGYGEDAMLAIKHGFGEIAEKAWFSWMGWWTNLFMPVYPDAIASTSAGLIINGSAFLNCVMGIVLGLENWLKDEDQFGQSEAQGVLEDAIKDGKFDELNTAGVGDSVSHYRRGVESSYSLLSCCEKARSVESGEELQPINRQIFNN